MKTTECRVFLEAWCANLCDVKMNFDVKSEQQIFIKLFVNLMCGELGKSLGNKANVLNRHTSGADASGIGP